MDWGHTTRARPVVTEQNISKKASACARLCCWHWQHKNLLFWHLASPSSSSSSPIPYAIALLFTFLSCDCAVAHGPHAWHSSSPYAVWWPEARQGQRQWRTHACMDDRRVPGSCSCSGGVFGGPSNPNLHPPDRSISLVRHPMIDKALLAVF